MLYVVIGDLIVLPVPSAAGDVVAVVDDGVAVADVGGGTAVAGDDRVRPGYVSWRSIMI